MRLAQLLSDDVQSLSGVDYTLWRQLTGCGQWAAGLAVPSTRYGEALPIGAILPEVLKRYHLTLPAATSHEHSHELP